MKYTIPYEDKIGLPHIKDLVDIQLTCGDIVKEDEDLLGKVIIEGEYYLENDEDSVMEFTHEIPISLLVDDMDVDPRIEIMNLEYEVVKGRGIELLFDLDVSLESREEKFQEEVDQKLDEALNNRNEDPFTKVNTDLESVDLEDDAPSVEEVYEDEDDVRDESVPVVDLDLGSVAMSLDDLLVDEETTEALDNAIDVKTALPKVVAPVEEVKALHLSSIEEKEAFDVGFISRTHDRYTTYKIIILEEDETIEGVLEDMELPFDLIDERFSSDGNKYVLKIEDE